MNPSQRGAIAETAITAHATRIGFRAFLPVADGGRYDMILEAAGKLLRVQCKTAVRRGEVVVVEARSSRRTADGHLREVYTPDDVDVIAAYSPELDRCFAIPIHDVPPSGGLHLRLAPTRNGQRAGLHFADQYPSGL
jgi:hypothetical protein